MTLKEFYELDARYLTEEAFKIWADSDQCLYDFIKQYDKDDYKGISETIVGCFGEEEQND